MIGRQKRQNTLKRVAIGSAVAAAAGYVAGVLTAPKSGKQTRAGIKTSANKGVLEAEKDLKKLHTELGKVIDDSKQRGSKLSGKAKKEFGELVDKAKETKEKAREVLSAVHEGDAADQDLSKAVKDAKRAVTHLKDYWKK
jgi:gas vesicle protein